MAVEAFLNQQIRFTDIPVIIEQVLANRPDIEPQTLSLVQQADYEARQLAREYMSTLPA